MGLLRKIKKVLPFFSKADSTAPSTTAPAATAATNVDDPNFAFNPEVVTRLREVDPKTVATVPYTDRLYEGLVIKVYDGDTITVMFTPEPGKFIKKNIRVEGIDTPEIKRASALEMKAGKAVADKIRTLLLNNIYWLKITKYDKYGGRMVGTIYINPKTTLGDYLIEKGWAKPYFGKAKEEWTQAQLQKIIKSAA